MSQCAGAVRQKCPKRAQWPAKIPHLPSGTGGCGHLPGARLTTGPILPILGDRLWPCLGPGTPTPAVRRGRRGLIPGLVRFGRPDPGRLVQDSARPDLTRQVLHLPWLQIAHLGPLPAVRSWWNRLCQCLASQLRCREGLRVEAGTIPHWWLGHVTLRTPSSLVSTPTTAPTTGVCGFGLSRDCPEISPTLAGERAGLRASTASDYFCCPVTYGNHPALQEVAGLVPDQLTHQVARVAYQSPTRLP